ncbi:MAG: DUF1405 domain-containing protein [Thermoplasmatota archaeon]
MLDPVWRFFAWFRDTTWTRRAIIGVDAIGVIYGFIYYGEQFQITPVITWPFVPDSPLAVLWALLALTLMEFGKDSAILESLAFVGNVEVGLWTGFVLLYYNAAPWPSLNFVLFWAHLGMVAHAFLFVRSLRARSPRRMWIGFGVAAAYYILNLYLDYFWTGYTYPPGPQGCVGLHPVTLHSFAQAVYGNPCGGLGVVAEATTVLLVGTLALLALLLITGRRSPTTKPA